MPHPSIFAELLDSFISYSGQKEKLFSICKETAVIDPWISENLEYS